KGRPVTGGRDVPAACMYLCIYIIFSRDLNEGKERVRWRDWRERVPKLPGAGAKRTATDGGAEGTRVKQEAGASRVKAAGCGVNRSERWGGARP
uniref:Uncharacterized protein n=1 Tax=Callorhinchus milii TaxID=7868 RepID=A0A4W3JCV3_CALMI